MKRRVLRILLAALLFLGSFLPGEGSYLALALLLGAYLLAGWDVLWYALRNLMSGQVFGESLLMAIATLGALSIGEYAEAVAVMLFYQTGEAFQAFAVGRSRRSISGLMDLRPDYANLLVEGEPRRVSPEEVKVGDLLLVRPGEKVPLDGCVMSGSSALDTAMLTGEPLPREVEAGSELLSGCVNLRGPLTLLVTQGYQTSTVARILDLVENAAGKKSRSERFITRFSAVYTPVVVLLAALLALVPPLLTGASFSLWGYRALNFLVVSCPCALVISIPLSFFGGIGGASRQGILVKGANHLEALAQAGTVVFDKTGTLTRGQLSVSEVVPAGLEAPALLQLAARLESHSNHPIAQSLRAAWGGPLSGEGLEAVQEVGGRGISARVDGVPALLGNAAWLQAQGVAPRAQTAAGTAVHLALDGVYAGHILLSDSLKPGAPEAVRQLKALGIGEIALLSGDSQAAALAVGQALGIAGVHAGLLPQDKVAQVERMMQAQPAGRRLVFVGDGINDAPVLARADIGVAMGGLGSDAAIEAADVVLMNDDPLKLPQAIRIARKTLGIARQNAFLAIGVKGLVLVLSALGYASLWAAVFADVGVTVLAVLNAMRTLRLAGQVQ
ncbi:MAG: heavy metal translocating P-type ATPase [Christensenellales bacterium]